MPRPVSSRDRYLPGLDGLRAIAVVAVLGYHLDVSWLSGGLLGVGMFFTLSGYLITMILLRTWKRTGGLDLGNFWLRRARRLLPAVILVLVVVLVATLLVAPADLAARWRESVAAMFYVSNWTIIAEGVSYFERFGGPGSLDHLWSLAVEEQFYLVWPLVLLGLLKVTRGRLSRVAVVTLVLAGLSFLLMMQLAEPGFDNTRAYEGTDTRAGGVLVGAALAMVWRPDRLTATISPLARWLVDGTGLAALAVITWLFVVTDPFSLSLYRGGILVLSVATALLVAVVVHPASRLARLLAVAPLVWLGERSYGIYLWHLPIIAFTPESVLVDQALLRGAIQVALTLVLAQLSWVLLEDPIRRHGLRGALQRGSSRLALPAALGRRRPPALVSGTAAVLVLGVLVLVAPPVLGGTARQPAADAVEALAPPLPPATSPTPSPTETVAASGSASPSPRPTPSATVPAVTPSPTATASPTPDPTPADPRTSCSEVVHIGDSTSIGLIEADYLPDADARIDAQYAEVGADFRNEIDGAQSIIETYQDHPNAQERIDERLGNGFDGCWVFAIGTNDAGAVAQGAAPAAERIDLVMDQIGNMPAMWTTLRTLEDSGAYDDALMQDWNEALLEGCTRHPNMRVYDWRAEVADDWFLSDRIHFVEEGYVQRSRRIAEALATAFPASGSSPDGCVIRTDG